MSWEMMQYNSKNLMGKKRIQINGMGRMREVWNGNDNDNNRRKIYD